MEDLPLVVLARICDYLGERDVFKFCQISSSLRKSATLIHSNDGWRKSQLITWKDLSTLPGLGGSRVVGQKWLARLEPHASHPWANRVGDAEVRLLLEKEGVRQCLVLHVCPFRSADPELSCSVICRDRWGVDWAGVAENKQVTGVRLVETRVRGLVQIGGLYSVPSGLRMLAVLFRFHDWTEQMITFKLAHQFEPRSVAPFLDAVRYSIHPEAVFGVTTAGLTEIFDRNRLLSLPFQSFFLEKREWSVQEGVVDSYGLLHGISHEQGTPLSLPQPEMSFLCASSVFDLFLRNEADSIDVLRATLSDRLGRSRFPISLVMTDATLTLIHGRFHPSDQWDFRKLVKSHGFREIRGPEFQRVLVETSVADGVFHGADDTGLAAQKIGMLVVLTGPRARKLVRTLMRCRPVRPKLLREYHVPKLRLGTRRAGVEIAIKSLDEVEQAMSHMRVLATHLKLNLERLSVRFLAPNFSVFKAARLLCGVSSRVADITVIAHDDKREIELLIRIKKPKLFFN